MPLNGTKKYIVTTTINSPTEALIKFSQMTDWTLIVVGDLKTTHESYKDINCIYLSPEEQESKYPILSELLGWNCLQRRNIGFIEAYKLGAEIIATVDDDNVPQPGWGENLLVNKEVAIDTYDCDEVFDALSVTNHNYLWHRGYPIELLKSKNSIKYLGKKNRQVLIQADLWNGDPDVDAIARIAYKPIVKFDVNEHYCSTKTSPFNSQNTFLSRKVIPYYFMFPYVGRMDDIWAAYYVQSLFKDCLIFGPASVYHDRNQHNLVNDIELEMIGYRNTLSLIKDPVEYINKQLPEKSIKAYYEYKRILNEKD